MSRKEEKMISEMWDIFGSFSTSRCDMLGKDLYREVGEYLGWFEDEDEEDDDFIDSELE